MRRGRQQLLAAIMFFLSAQSLHAICAPGNLRLCLQEQRFQISVEWKDFSGNHGSGTAVQLTPDTGYFWFFDSKNVEIVVKVLDGRSLNEHYWLFYGALSNVAYTLTVTDTVSGKVKVYTNPSGHLASVADTLAFSSPLSHEQSLSSHDKPRSKEPGQAIAPASTLSASDSRCVPTESTLCLNNGRFKLTSFWRDFQGNLGPGHAVSLTGDTGYFWFFSPSNVELVAKALDGRPLNSSFWLFYGALSNVEYVLEVTDTVTGVKKAYRNAPGKFASIADTGAFQDNTDAGAYASAAYDRFMAALDGQANLSSPEAANTFYALADPAKDILRCLKRAAASATGASCRGFDPQTGSYRDVLVPPDQSRRIASLLSIDAVSLESLSGGASSPPQSPPGSTEKASTQSCPYSAGATTAWYLTCEALRSDVATLLSGVVHWGCILGVPSRKRVVSWSWRPSCPSAY